MSSIRMKRGVVAAVTGLGLVAAPLAFTPGAVGAEQRAATSSSDLTRLRLLAINDFHGQLEKLDPAVTSSGRVGGTPAGGAEYLATHLKRLRASARAHGVRTMTVAAGDLIGATPLLSAAFHDEPTIEAMNMMGLDITSVGNHEFDEGWRELKRMQRGGCLDDGAGEANQDSCPDGSFDGADFRYLAANVKRTTTGKTILRPFSIREVDGKKVGFIGMTLEDTPNIVTKSGVEGLEFTDEVKTANALVPELRERGVEAIVVLLHEGGAPAALQPSGCADVTGPGIDIAEQLHPEIDVVVSGHTHQPYICTVKDPAGRDRLITSAYSVGRVVTSIDLTLGRRGEVKRGKTVAQNHTVTNQDVDPNAAMTALIARYKTLVAPIANAVVGQIAPADTKNTLSRTKETNGYDSPLGNLIADAQKVDPSIVPTEGPRAGVAPVVAFMNPGGIRADLVENDAKVVTYGAAFDVQPFNNYDATLDLTGDQIIDLLNQQWNERNEAAAFDPAKPTADRTATYKVLQVSGLSYTWDKSLALETGVDAIVGDVLIDHDGDDTTAMTPLVPGDTYRVAANAFLADGGDGFSVFAQGTNKFLGGLDIDALVDYLGTHQPYTPSALDRISSVD